MKFVAIQSNIKEAISVIERVVGENTNLPILKNISPARASHGRAPQDRGRPRTRERPHRERKAPPGRSRNTEFASLGRRSSRRVESRAVEHVLIRERWQQPWDRDEVVVRVPRELELLTVQQAAAELRDQTQIPPRADDHDGSEDAARRH